MLFLLRTPPTLLALGPLLADILHETHKNHLSYYLREFDPNKTKSQLDDLKNMNRN